MKALPRLLVAAGLGLVASGAMFFYVSSNGQRAEGAEPTRMVVVAKTPIEANAKLTGDELATEPRPSKYVPQGALSDPQAAVGRTVRIAMSAGDPVLESQLFAKGQELQTVLPVPAGMRAVTVAVDEVVGVAGFVQPGMIVDVISTMDVENRAVTKFLLQKVKILACAQNAKHQNDPEAKVVSSATLAVSPDQAEKLILAADRGKIRLAMRDPRETADVKTSGATPESLLGIVPKTAEARPKVVERTRIVRVVVPAKPEAAPDIMIIRGTSTELVSR